MDYHSVHGHDVASFDIPSSHRLPTVSASAALDSLEHDTGAYIPTGLEDLDKALRPDIQVITNGNPSRGGIKRSQVTEVWGPPGTAKTSLGIQLAANAAYDGLDVVWVDCFQSVPSERVTAIFEAVKASRGLSSLPNSSDQQVEESRDHSLLDKFIHYECLTLPHLLALISRPNTRSIPSNVGLVIISSISALINSALPKALDRRLDQKIAREANPSVKRRQALQTIMKGLQTLASTRNCAVVVLSPCATKMHSERGATLTPAINANLWEQGISTQLVLFRDWTAQKEELAPVFLAGIQKLDGRSMRGSVEHVSALQVTRDGISSVAYNASQPLQRDMPNVARQKRKLGHTNFEIPDSEDDEDYGWAEEDEAALPPQPPQWQGSEDILIGTQRGHSDDEQEDEEDNEDDENDSTSPPASATANGGT